MHVPVQMSVSFLAQKGNKHVISLHMSINFFLHLLYCNQGNISEGVTTPVRI